MKSLLLFTLLLSSVKAFSQEKVSFRGEITPRSLSALEGRIAKALKKIRPDRSRTIRIELNSGGGNLYATLDFISRMRSFSRENQVRLQTYVSSSCESSCTVLFTLGEDRIAKNRARFGFHSPAIESRLPRGVRADDVLSRARARWISAISAVDPVLAEDVLRREYLEDADMSYYRGRDLLTGYVSEII